MKLKDHRLKPGGVQKDLGVLLVAEKLKNHRLKPWLTLGKPLKNRLNIVLTRDSSIEPQESLLVLNDVDSVISFSKSLTTDLFVIGGAQVYREFLPHIEKWLITKVPVKVENADAFMPEGYLDGFASVATKKLDADLKVVTYEPR